MKRLLIAAVSILTFLQAEAQDISTVLGEIEKNNVELQALRADNKASGLSLDSENTLEAPSVEYSPFFRKGAGGVASSELVVSQEFDFPTMYSARKKANKMQKEVMESEYGVRRRDLLLAAKEKCLDLIFLNKARDILQKRKGDSDALLSLYDKKMSNGDATALEINKIKMERIGLETELLQNEGMRRAIEEELTALNGNKPMSAASISEYPAMVAVTDAESLKASLMRKDPGVISAIAAVNASREEMNVARQGWIPKLSVGYRRNTEGDEASNGFLVGASFPIFSNGKKVKSAAARRAAAELYREDAYIKAESELNSALLELDNMKKSIAVFDVALMEKSLELLKKSVDAGNLSLIDYYTETDKIYTQLSDYLQMENQYQKVTARLYSNEL